MKKFFRLVLMLAVAGLTFAYTSCSDYSKDIDTVDDRVDDLQSQFDAFKSATNESITKINDLVADLQKTISALETKEDHQKDVDALNKLIEGLKSDASALAGRVTAIENDLANYVKTSDLTETLKSYLKVTDFNTTIGGITGRLDVIEGKLNPLAAKYDSELKISEIISLIDDVKATANDASQKVAALRTDVDVLQKALAGYTEAGAIQAKFNAVDSVAAEKLDISAFKTEFDKYFQDEFDEAFKTAIEISCKDGGDVYKAIYAALNPAVETLEGKISDLDDKINDVLGIVLNRIQSIVFVPEFDDMNATLHHYYVKKSGKIIPFSDTKTVDATFEVYPAKLVGTINKDDVSIVAVNVATRAAAAAVAGEIVDFKVNDTTGRVTVTAKFGKDVSYDSANKKSFAISLRVKEDTKKTIDGDEYDAGNYVESSFVGVSLCDDSDLTDRFVVYNKTTEKVLASDTVCVKEAQWFDAPAAWDPFEGYDFYIKLGTDTAPEYLTIAEAAAKFCLPVADLTPAIANTPSFNPASSSKYFNHVAKDKAKNLGDFVTEMVKAEVIKADGTVVPEAVGAVCNDAVKATVKGVEVFKATTSYKIGRRKVTMTIDPYTVNWTYGMAVKLSSAKSLAGAYQNAINAANLDNELLNELKVKVEGDVEGFDIKKVVTGVVPTANHKLNGKDIPTGAKVPQLKVDPVAIVSAHLASVEVVGGTYEFGKDGKANVYTLCNTYANDATFTDIDVKMTLTLGSLPKAVKVVVPEQKISYEPQVVLHKVTEAATIEEAFNQAGGKSTFKDLAEFKADFLNGTEKSVKAQRTNAKTPVNCSGYSYFSVTDRVLADTPFIRLSQADLTSYDDTFAFETKVDTWYGLTYNFATTATLDKPVYGLIYHEDLVDMTKEIPTVKISGTKDSGTYEINTDDLNKYFGIEKCNAAVATYLKINYEYVTPLSTDEWKNKGYENIPALPAEIDGSNGTDVMADGSLAARNITWGSYTARDMVIKATLSCNGVEVNSLNLKLTIDDPIAEVSIEDIAVKRSPYEDVKVNLWSTTTVKSILSDANQVNQNATTIAGMWNWNADTAYGLKLTYDDEYTVFVNGKDVTAQFPASKFVFDADAGTITYNKDAAYQANDVIVEVTAYLTHKFNYNNKNEEELHKNTYKFKVVISE